MIQDTIPHIKESPVVSLTSNLEPELDHQDVPGIATSSQPIQRPRLACKMNIYSDQIILSQDDRDFYFPINGQSGEALQQLFSMMDGTRSLSELQQMFSPNDAAVLNTIVRNLDEQGLLDDLAQLRVDSGIDTLLELETLTHELLDQSFEENPFWKLIKSTATELPIQVLYGFAIENYHFFSRKYCFQSPVLSFGGSIKVRQLLNELYHQEYGQDKLMIAALNTIGIDHEELMDTMALPETIAMCNGLAFWANFEPLFFLSTMGVLGARIYKNFELYLAACERLKLDSRFIYPIRKLVNTNLKGEQKNLTRRIFQEIPHIDRETRQRFRRQTYLFIEMYNNFHTAISHYYSSAPHLLRRVSAI
ncbi:MAG: hypothetical protein QNJ55_12040 [Xenococcus sp. MO_188.B8]|nr:hypothetical protein [Xenococcus sp. MO_188.B8]